MENNVTIFSEIFTENRNNLYSTLGSYGDEKFMYDSCIALRITFGTKI